MASPQSSPPSDLVASELRTLAESITDMIERVKAARPLYTLEQFLNLDTKKYGTKGGLTQLFPVYYYARCFRALDTKNREEFDALYKRRLAETKIRDAVDELLRSEANFLAYVSELDQEVKAAEDKLAVSHVLSVGSHVPTELELLDADSGSAVSLGTVLGKAPFTLFVFKRHYI
jgi:hypothetical protein